MKKLIIVFLLLGINTYAEILKDGLYSTDDKCIEIKLQNNEYLIENYVTFQDKEITKRGKLLQNKNEIIFDGLKSIFYSEENYGKEAYRVVAIVTEDNSFEIQNYGNSMNTYIVFGQCQEKYIHFSLNKNTLNNKKDEISNNTNPSLTLKELFENAKTNQKLTTENINEVLKSEELNTKNLQKYNDIAYYLQQSNANEEAIFLLEKILEKFPNRTVAYLNLAYAYNGVGSKEKAKINFEKYISLMKQDGKESKIPQRVLEFK